ncbi:MAG: ABC transporter substrate-binding protein [Treponema sp.]|nr:ABC transporter substrate-binding protein [Treponema sp.]
MKKIVVTVALLMLATSVFASGNRNAAPAASSSEAVYRSLYSGEVSTYNYLVTANTNDWAAYANLVDTLIEYDKYGVIKPALATTWEHSNDLTVWTFKIRQGVKWVDHTGKVIADVTANDWVSTAHYIVEASNGAHFGLYGGYVKNAQEYYEQSGTRMVAANAVKAGEYRTVEDYYAANNINPASLSLTLNDIGVKALDTYTLQYTLERPVSYYLSIVSNGPYMPVYKPFLDQQGINFGIGNENLLYNGAYLLSSHKPQQERVYVKNPTYWDKDNVFINRLEHTYNAEAARLSPVMFQRGEVDSATINSEMVTQWLSNPATKDLVRNSPPDRSYSYFYLFNFEPRFDAVYEPDNWLIAVNNENFRQSLFYALDRLRALSVLAPDAPESLVNNSITPAAFSVGAGKDYTQYPALKPISDRDSFIPAKALEYKAQAIPELRTAGATFPIKILMPYNPTVANWDKECQLVEQQMEALLGADYIDIILEAGPSTGFLQSIRRSGKYAFMKCNCGAGYVDPETWITPFGARDNTYNFMYQDESKTVDGKPAINKSPATQALATEYLRLQELGRAIADIVPRYTALADAEAFAINHALAIPFSVDTYGYVANRIDPFEQQYAPFGIPPFRFKGLHLLAKPMSNDDYHAAYTRWLREREAAIAASN